MSDVTSRHAELLTWLVAQGPPDSGTPVYLHLRGVLTQAIQDGRLRPGDSLPAVRVVAAALELAPNTVARTYALLQQDGLTENRAGAGTRVRPDSAAGQRSGLLELRRQVQALREAGLSDDELRAAVETVLSGQPAPS